MFGSIGKNTTANEDLISPSSNETAKAIAAIYVNKTASFVFAITIEVLQWGGDQMIDTIHALCSDVDTMWCWRKM